MTNDPSPDTIVLIHGFWVTPRSWEHWAGHYEGKGYRVLTPAYPGFEVEVEALNADPSPIEALTVTGVVEHLKSVVRELDSPPILIGHSAGGTFVQLLLDRGLGAVGVAMNSAPTEGVRAVPLSQLKSTFPVFKNPANRHRAVGFTHDDMNKGRFCGRCHDGQVSFAVAGTACARYHVPTRRSDPLPTPVHDRGGAAGRGAGGRERAEGAQYAGGAAPHAARRARPAEERRAAAAPAGRGTGA